MSAGRGERVKRLPVEEVVRAFWGLSELRRVRQLGDENRRPQGLVADVNLEKQMLSAALA